MHTQKLLLVAVVSSALIGNTTAAPQLEEVVVTAQKKEESLQDTPIALDAFGSQALEAKGIAGVADLADNVPALQIQPFPISSSTLRIYIRGIGLIDAQITQDPPVGVYIDGAYIARSAGLATDIADLARIEVLRGPQGTLYGRNSTGGAVNLVTKRPNVDATEFEQKFTFGKFNKFISKTSLNLPLWEGAAAKAALYKKQVDGYIKNGGEGGDYGDNDTLGLRLDFGWDINDDMRVDYTYDYTEIDSVNLTYSDINPSTDLPTPVGASREEAQGIAFTNLVRQGARSLTNFNPSGKRPSSIDSPVEVPNAETEIEGHQVSFSWNLSETLDFKYIFAYRELFDAPPTNLASNSITDGYRLDNNAIFSFPVAASPGGDGPCAGDPAAIAASPGCAGRSVQYDGFVPDLEQDQFSHEFQLTGDLFDGQVSYITGLYYFEEEASQSPGTVGHLTSGPLGDTGFGTRIEVLTQARYSIENTALALFSQFTWRPSFLDDRFAITLGARHSRDKRKAESFRRQINFLVINPDFNNTQRRDTDNATQLAEDFYDLSADESFSDNSFGLTFEWEVTDTINMYLKRSEAYKSGGFNTREPIDDGGASRFLAGFDQEKVTAYELGLKSRLFENRVQVNANIFQQDIEDQQLNFSIPGETSDTTVANAGSSTLKGFEMDTTILAAEGLIFVLNYAYLDASIDPSVNPLAPEAGPDDGFVFDSAPRHAYTAAIDWTVWSSAEKGRVGFNASYSFTDERNGGARREFAGFDADRQDDYAVSNARIGWYDIPAANGIVNVALFGKNLGDEEYSVSNIHNLPSGSRSVIFGEPRTIGLDLSYQWAN